MAPKPKPQAQRKPAAKALARKELEVAQKLPSIQKVASRKRATLGKEDHPPATASPASATTQTSGRRMRSATQPVVSTSDIGNAATAAAVPEVSQDPRPVGTDTVMAPEVAAELATLRAQVAALQRAQDGVSSSSQDPVRIPRPAKIRNLRAAMQLGDDDDKYPEFRADLRQLVTIANINPEVNWTRQDVTKVGHVTTMIKTKYAFLDRYDGDWPIKEYLKKHLSNKRYYDHSTKPTRAKGQRKFSRYNIAMDDLFNFGSEEDARNGKSGDEGSDEDARNGKSGDEGSDEDES